MEKIASQLKEVDKVYLLIKNQKTRKRVKNLAISRLDHFSLRLKKKLLTINSGYLTILKYISYIFSIIIKASKL